MLDSVKRKALVAAVALSVSSAAAVSLTPVDAAPLAGEGSMAAMMNDAGHPTATDVAWRRHYWGPGALVAGATLGVLGAALAAPSYGYCGPYGYCGAYPGYYAYYPGPYYGYGYGYYHPHRYWHRWRRW